MTVVGSAGLLNAVVPGAAGKMGRRPEGRIGAYGDAVAEGHVNYETGVRSEHRKR